MSKFEPIEEVSATRRYTITQTESGAFRLHAVNKHTGALAFSVVFRDNEERLTAQVMLMGAYNTDIQEMSRAKQRI
jgi:hypothetical protein